ncbi:hypothetical protein OPT61_g10312 [Boeremia exigua]|uniref:Uncharacterized protein n=1 Tax=Boeremia exigua TaxID=749465 RepID=A0ACC2HQV2_9PLEO|nr:hypothetical protein OPT61_g10312 [Boeremia exigua]
MEIVDFCKDLASTASEKVRICVSSGEEPEIVHTFASDSGSPDTALRIEKHTRRDIEDYTNRKFEQIKKFVVLVCRDIVRSSQSGISVDDLFDCLKHLQQEKNVLYLQILERRDEKPRAEAELMLVIVACAGRNLSVEEFQFVLRQHIAGRSKSNIKDMEQLAASSQSCKCGGSDFACGMRSPANHKQGIHSLASTVSRTMLGVGVCFSVLEKTCGERGLNDLGFQSTGTPAIQTLLFYQADPNLAGNGKNQGCATPLKAAVILYTGYERRLEYGFDDMKWVISLLLEKGALADPATRRLASSSSELKRHFRHHFSGLDQFFSSFATAFSGSTSASTPPIDSPSRSSHRGSFNATIGMLGPRYPHQPNFKTHFA